jgi:peptidoglycan hydrolase-like protein with peptidoglycan-binding domain
MKKPLTLAALILLSSGALLAQEAGQALSVPQGNQATKPAPQDQKAKKGQAKGQPSPGSKESNASKFSKAQIMKVQEALRRYDYYDGPLDGRMSTDLRQAIKDFQDDEGLDATGELDDETYKRALALMEEESGEESPSTNRKPHLT